VVAHGTLIVLRALRQPEGAFHEEKMPFATLQELLDLCVRHAPDAAFVRVQVEGESEGKQHRLVLDFGHFGREGPAEP